MKCWTKAGYIRRPGTKKGTKGSCYKPSKKKQYVHLQYKTRQSIRW